MDSEADIDYELDSPTVAFNKNVTIGKLERTAIVDGLRRFFNQQYDINPEWLEFHLSNSIAEDVAEEGPLRPVGVHLGVSDAYALSTEVMSAVYSKVPNFANDVAVQTFRTFQSDNMGFTANTWEDVILGLNKSFEKAGSDVRIDVGILQAKRK